MKVLARYGAGYVLDCFRERVTADDFRGEGITRVLVVPGLGDRAVAAMRRMFPQAELRLLNPHTGVWEVRRERFQAAVIPMAGGPAGPRLTALLSGARHKLLVPSSDHIYRFGIRQGWVRGAWAMVDRFLLAPLALMWLAATSVWLYASGLVGTAARAEAGGEVFASILVIRLTPPSTFLALLGRLRERWPRSRVTALIASPEGKAQTGGVAEVVCSPDFRPLGLLRRVRRACPELVVLAGGADYVLRPTYWKAAMLAALAGAKLRRQWEVGEDLPGRPLGQALRAVLARSARRLWFRYARPAIDFLQRPRLRRVYHQLPRRGPRLVQIGITEACNYRCLMCPFHNPVVDRKHRESELPRMSYELFARLLRDLKEMGTKAVDICGNGEPLTHPEAIEMIALAQSMNFEVSLATNAALLTEQRAQRLVDLGLRRMHVSINAGTSETYSQMHPGTRPGTFEAIIGRLRGMADYADASGQRRVDVEFSAVLTRLNRGEIVQMVEAAHQARANWLMLILMGPVEGQPDLPPGPQDWPAIREEAARAKELAEQLGVRSNLKELEATGTPAGTGSVYQQIPCYIGHEFALIIAGGAVIFCCHCHEWLGHLSEEDFATIWKSKAYQEARRQAMSLPTTRKSLPDCGCFYACSHVSANLAIHRRLYGKRALRSTR